ncbi:spectrin beta chain [Anaeramoeba flamelloides]|uniref:Spectrin beta chain n=1 Tax=Anaeramoeba flamelloides TaxID=1746091 RepID=A0ABQ8XRE0_9EUKA|nr:spectrin beta chain [Anaeramoeba flamelloides]
MTNQRPQSIYLGKPLNFDHFSQQMLKSGEKQQIARRKLQKPNTTPTKSVNKPLNISIKFIDLSFFQKVQIVTLIKWVRFHLPKSHSNNFRSLAHGFDNGFVLIKLIENILSIQIPNVKTQVKTKIDKIDNIRLAINFLKKVGVPLEITANHILSHEEKRIMIMLWKIILFYSVKGLPIESNEPTKFLMEWCRVATKEYSLSIDNFYSSFIDGRAFCAILHSFDNSLFDYQQFSQEKPEVLLKKAFDLGDLFSIPKLFNTRSIFNGELDKHSMVIYICELFQKFSKTEQIVEVLTNLKIPKKQISEYSLRASSKQIHNLTSDRKFMHSKSFSSNIEDFLNESLNLNMNQNQNMNKKFNEILTKSNKKWKNEITDQQKKYDEKIVEIYHKLKESELKSQQYEEIIEELKKQLMQQQSNNSNDNINNETETEMKELLEEYEKELLILHNKSIKDEENYKQILLKKNQEIEEINYQVNELKNQKKTYELNEIKHQTIQNKLKLLDNNVLILEEDLEEQKEKNQRIEREKQQLIEQLNNNSNKINNNTNEEQQNELIELIEKLNAKVEEQEQEIIELFNERENISETFHIKYSEVLKKNELLEEKMKNDLKKNENSFEKERNEFDLTVQNYENIIKQLKEENNKLKLNRNMNKGNGNENKNQELIQENKSLKEYNKKMYNLNQELNTKLKKKKEKNELLEKQILEVKGLLKVNYQVSVNEIEKLTQELNENKKENDKTEKMNQQLIKSQNEEIQKLKTINKENTKVIDDFQNKLTNFENLEKKNDYQLKELNGKFERSQQQQKLLQNSNNKKSRSLEELESKLENELEVLKEIVDDLKEKLESKKKFKRSKKKKNKLLEEMDIVQMKLMYEQQNSLLRQKRSDYNSLSQILNKKMKEMSELKKTFNASQEGKQKLTNEIRSLREKINELNQENNFYKKNFNNNTDTDHENNNNNNSNDSDGSSGDNKQNNNENFNQLYQNYEENRYLKIIKEKDEELKKCFVKISLLGQIKGENELSDEKSNEIIMRLANSLADMQLGNKKLEKELLHYKNKLQQDDIQSENKKKSLTYKKISQDQAVLLRELDRLDSLIF